RPHLRAVDNATGTGRERRRDSLAGADPDVREGVGGSGFRLKRGARGDAVAVSRGEIWSAALALSLATGCAAAAPGGPGRSVADATARDGYRVWVTSESVDEVSLLRFDGDSLRVEKRIRVGSMPLEIDGPHGVAVSPDGRFVYVSLGHGTPFG